MVARPKAACLLRKTCPLGARNIGCFLSKDTVFCLLTMDFVLLKWVVVRLKWIVGATKWAVGTTKPREIDFPFPAFTVSPADNLLSVSGMR